MSLLSSLLPKKETLERLLILGVGEHHIRAAVVELGAATVILGSGESEFGEGENESEAVDVAISMAEKELSEDMLVEKVIFALPQSYIDHDHIKPEYMDRLKKISKDLMLAPQGFIEYPEAIAFYLEKEEGSPATVLLLEVSRSYLSFAFMRVGKVQQHITIARSDSIVTDFSSVIGQFQTEILPSRIILYDESDKLESLVEELLRFPWHKHSLFLHTPKIEVLTSKKILDAMVTAASSSFVSTKGNPEEFHTDLPITPPVENTKKELEKDVIKESKDLKKKESPVQNEETFGFVEESAKSSVKPTGFDNTLTVPNTKTSPLTSLSSKLAGLIPNNLSFPKPRVLPRLSYILFGVSILILIIATVLLIRFYPKTSVSLIVYPLSDSTSINVTFTTNANSVSSGKNAIVATTQMVEVTSEKKAPTTGKNKVGDKAKGEVTIFNKTLSGKTFPKGTVIGSGDLKFTLDDDIQIASASDTGEGLTFGKTIARVTAGSIGPEGNLAQGSSFTFKDFPESSSTAKNSAAFSGGTSRDIASVSKDDQDNLENQLTAELVNQARQKLIEKLSPGAYLLEESLTKSVISKKFSVDVGNEAREVKLALTISVSALSYEPSDLTGLALESASSPPNGYTLDHDRIGIKIGGVKTDKTGTISAKATVTSYYLPDLSLTKIKQDLVGISYQQTANYLTRVTGVAGVKINEINSLPFYKNRLPLVGNNLMLGVVTY